MRLCLHLHATLIKRGENTPLIQSWVPKTAGRKTSFTPPFDIINMYDFLLLQNIKEYILLVKEIIAPH